jgi:hypothetical protein
VPEALQTTKSNDMKFFQLCCGGEGGAMCVYFQDTDVTALILWFR